MSRHRLPAEQGCMLFDPTMMFALEEQLACLGNLPRSRLEAWPCLRGMAGLGEALRSSACSSQERCQPSLPCRLEVIQLSLLGDACGGRGAMAAEMPACAKRFSGDASSKSLKHRRWSPSHALVGQMPADRPIQNSFFWWPA